MEFLMQTIGRSAVLEEVGEFGACPSSCEWRCAGGAGGAGAAQGGGERRSTDLVGGGDRSGQKGELPSDV